MALDLDMVSAICPNCHITLVEANDAGGSMMTAVARANTMGAKYVSMNWGWRRVPLTRVVRRGVLRQPGRRLHRGLR